MEAHALRETLVDSKKTQVWSGKKTKKLSRPGEQEPRAGRGLTRGGYIRVSQGIG